MKKEIITYSDPKSPISEVFRTLRTNLQYMSKKEKTCQTILITSTVQREGKSFITANLAITFAQANKKTLIVDSDMRRPRQHTIFKIDMYPGLSNYLSGVTINRTRHKTVIEDCIYETKIDNLYLMPAGNIPPNPSELLQSGKLNNLLKEIEPNFDIIIFDGAPCLLVTDSAIISRFVDSTLVVASENKTKIKDLKEVKRRINHVGGKIAGVVLNRVRISKKQYGSSYYYGSNTSIAKRNEFLNFSKNRYKSSKDEKDIEELEEDSTEDDNIEEDIDKKSMDSLNSNDSVKNNNTKNEEKLNKNDDNTPESKINEIIEQINNLKYKDK